VTNLLVASGPGSKRLLGCARLFFTANIIYTPIAILLAPPRIPSLNEKKEKKRKRKKGKKC
jgi:hypothetical protein